MPSLAQEAPGPLRVAECRRCGQLFAVASALGEVACPACEATIPVSALEVVELQVAKPVEKAAEKFVEKLPERQRPAESESVAAQALPKANPPAAGPPTVAEWLIQRETAQPALPAFEPQAERSETKRSLAESLGWRGDGEAAPAKGSLTNRESTKGPSAEPAIERNPLADFRFDFGATPLSEASTAKTHADEVTLELSGHPVEPTPPLFDPSVAAGKASRRGWSSVLSTAAGLLMIVVPGAYMALTWEDQPQLDGSLVVDGDASDTRERRASLAADEPAAFAPPSAFEAKPENEATPIVDPATKPASFSGGDAAEPKFDLPPSAPRVIIPPPTEMVEMGDAAESSVSEDPFATAGGPASPLADDEGSTTPEPAAQAAEANQRAFPSQALSTAPARLSPIGLRNAPRYGAAELSAALSDAEETANAFNAGSLADPAQVPAMGQHYARLCQLAQVLTLLDSSPNDTALTTAELQGVEVFKRLFRVEHSRIDAQQVAAHWIAWTGRPHGGVFFCGVPEDLSPVGEVVQYSFRLGDSVVPVVMAKQIDTDRFVNTGAREVGVLGVVVENPRDWIAGYDGEAERVVWARKTTPLTPPTQP